MTDNSALETARKLRNLSERAGTPAEAAAAAAALAKLLDRHRIDLRQLELDGKTTTEPFMADTDRPLTSWRRLEPWRRDLALVLGAHFGVACWLRTLQQRGQCANHSLHLCGRPSDIELVRQMYLWLSAELVRLCASCCRGRGARYGRSWRDGFVAGLDRQLRTGRAELSEQDSRAIVLYSRARSAADYLDSLFENMQSAKWRARNRTDLEAFREGARLGERLHLGGRIQTRKQGELPWHSDDT